MRDFEYSAPTSVAEAVALLGQHGPRAKMLAGGTDILVQLREDLREADVVVDVKKIPELTALTCSRESGLQLGAAVACWRIYGNADVAASYPALCDAARIIGGWQIQSRASIGGNLCNSSPAADSIPPLIAYRAVCHIAGPDGRRSAAVDQFCTGPGKNILRTGEILVAISLPAQGARGGAAYQRFIPRNEMDIAVAGAASYVKLDAGGETIEEARIALAAVAPTPVVAVEASQWLAGQPANDESFAKAGELAKQVAAPIADMRSTGEYRRHLVGVLVKRTLATAVQRARDNRTT